MVGNTNGINGGQMVVEKTYTNLTVPVASWLQIDTVSNIGGAGTLSSMVIKGWSGVTAPGPLTLVLSSDGQSVYIWAHGEGTISSIGVRYTFTK